MATRKTKAILIDTGYLAYRSMYSIYRAGSPVLGLDEEFRVGQAKSELGAYARAVALTCVALSKRFPDRDMVFCLDAPSGSWRSKAFRAWYDKNHSAYLDTTVNWEQDLYLTWDHKLFKISHLLVETEEGVTDLKREYLSLKSPLVKVKESEINPAMFVDTRLSKRLKDTVLPRYKGGRSVWPFALPKDQWKKYTRALMFNLSNTLGGTALEHEGLEADDLAYQTRAWGLYEDVIAYTSDRDWEQIAILGGKFARLGDPWGEPEEITKVGGWQSLLTKILSGDRSDNISSVLRENYRTFGQITAEKWLLKSPWADGGMIDPEEAGLLPDWFIRNKVLISMAEADHLFDPKKLTRCPEPEVKYTLKDFLIDSADLLQAELKAGAKGVES